MAMKKIILSLILSLSSFASAQSFTYLGRATVTTPQDMVFDSSRNLLYVTNTSNSVQVFSMPALTLQRTILVGTGLRCLDISPDFSKLAVTDANATRIAVINLATDAIAYYPYTSSGSDTGANDVAFADNNNIVFTGFNQWQSIYRLRLDTSTVTTIANSVYSPASLSSSADRSTLVYSENGISNGPFGTISTSSYTITKGGTNTSNSYSAVSPDGGIVATLEGSKVGIYQKSGNVFTRSGQVGANSGSMGMAFSRLHPYVFVSHNNTVSNTTPAIRAYRTDNYTVAGVVDSATNLFTSSSYSAYGPIRDGYLHASYDGRYLFAIVAATIRAYDVSLNLRSITTSVLPLNTGSVTGGASSALLTSSVTFGAAPQLGYMFTEWTGDFTSSSSSLTFTVTNNHSLVANFAPDTRDPDGDGLNTYHEVFVSKTDPTIADTDSDGSNDGLDVFPLDGNEWLDNDRDGLGNNADLDDDNDGYLDTEDTTPFVVNEVFGDFFALIDKDPILTKQHGGTVRLLVSQGGSATGVLETANELLRFKALGTATDYGWSYTIQLKRKDGGALMLSLNVIQKITGVLSSQIYSTNLQGWKRRYGMNERSAEQLSGRYNAHLKCISLNLFNQPGGWGYSQIRFEKNGIATALTTLPDGVRFTHSSVVGPSGEFGFWKQSKMLWSLSGALSLDPAIFPNQSIVSNQAHWLKARSTSAKASFYPQGVGTASASANINLTCSRYQVGDLAAPIAGYASGFGNARLTISPTLLNTAIFSPNGLFEIGSENNVLLDTPGSSTNPTNLAIKLNRETGQFEGKFLYTLAGEGGKRITLTLPFGGLFQSSTGIGGGFIMIPQTNSREVSSGSVLIEKAY